MQDATLRDKGQYRFYLYDKLERTVVQGLCNGYSRSEEMNIAEFKENIGGLCNTGYNIPLSDKITNPNLETVNYYYNYTFLQKYSAELGSLVSDFQVKGSCEQGDTGGYSTFDKEKNDLPIFHYYTQDHLGNNRIVTNEDGTVEQIVHYYPFGGIFNDTGLNTVLQQYKYNGKELDRIAGLNIYDYGARQYFSALPIWDRIDPKCEEDYGISPYAYCRNNPIKMLDKDGKRPGDFFLTMDAAAIDFGLFYNDNSIRENREYGTFIYRVTNKKGVSGYSYSFATIGEKDFVTIGTVPMGHTPAAVIHTHGSSTFNKQHEFYDNEFSGIRKDDKNKTLKTIAEKECTKEYDIGFSNNRKLDSYLVTPNGTLQKYNYKTGKIKVLSHDMPSDKNDPDRVNTVQSDFEMKPLSTLDILEITKNIMYENY